MKITVHTDGSSLHNGKDNCIGGWSAVIRLAGKLHVRYGHLSAPSSNNRGEIFGVLYSMLTFKSKPDWDIEFYSDSQYVCKSINEWRHKWKKYNYEGFKNADLLMPLFDMWDERRNANIIWVKGHAGNQGNEEADEFAGCGMRNIDRTMITQHVDIKKIEEETVLKELNARNY
jgi:ribonuclease HI